jgi:hypothetical protein
VNHNRWLVIALVVLTVVTLLQSVQVERSEAFGLARILNPASGHAMEDLARDGSSQMNDRFAFYLALRPYVEGGTVVLVNRPRTLATTAVRGLAGAELVVADFDPTIDAALARTLRDEARVEGAVSPSSGTIDAFGPAGRDVVHVVLVDEQGVAYVTAAEQLQRHGIEPPGLDLGDLLAGAADG